MDIDFDLFQWQTRPDGDLQTVPTNASFRQLVTRWLLTEPNRHNPLTQAEMETRRRDDGENLHACLPWAPNWGAGIKRYLNQPLTPALLTQLQTRLRAGLATIPGVTRVNQVRISSLHSRVTVEWSIHTAAHGEIHDRTSMDNTLS